MVAIPAPPNKRSSPADSDSSKLSFYPSKACAFLTEWSAEASNASYNGHIMTTGRDVGKALIVCQLCLASRYQAPEDGHPGLPLDGLSI
jgi:hypothetical protein